MELKRYLQIILRGWWLILPTLLISVTSALVFTYNQTPIYRTSATFIVSPNDSLGELDDVFRVLNTLSKREGVMMTYTEIAASRTIRDAVCKEMGLTKEQLEYLNVSSEILPSTNIIKITVESDDPLIAKDCANLIGQETIKYVGNLYEAYDIKLLDSAYTPRSPSKPKKAQSLMLAAMLGSLLGGGLAFVAEYLRSSGKTIAGVNIIDGDTGIYNRYYFLQRLGEELSRAKRHSHPLSMALMNIEHLDVISNMRLPHLRNEALRRVGLFLKQYLREEDLVARFEGDKFALLLPDTSASDAKRILEKLQTKMEWNLFELRESGEKLNLTGTSGIVTYDFNGTSRDELLARAEKALRCASDNGYGKIYLFDDSREEMDTDQYEPTTDR